MKPYDLFQERKKIEILIESSKRTDIPNRADICAELLDGPLSIDELRDRWKYPLDQQAHGKALECLNIGLVKLSVERLLELVNEP